MSMVAREHPLEAGAYEQALKRRPQAFSIRVRLRERKSKAEEAKGAGVAARNDKKCHGVKAAMAQAAVVPAVPVVAARGVSG